MFSLKLTLDWPTVRVAEVTHKEGEWEGRDERV